MLGKGKAQTGFMGLSLNVAVGAAKVGAVKRWEFVARWGARGKTRPEQSEKNGRTAFH